MKDRIKGTKVSMVFKNDTTNDPCLMEITCESDKDELAASVARKNDSFQKLATDKDAGSPGGIGGTVEVSGTYAHAEPREFEVEMQLKPGEGGALEGVVINTGIGRDRWEAVKVYPYLESFPKLTANGEALVMVPGVKPQACFYVDIRQCLCIEQRCKKMEEENEN